MRVVRSTARRDAAADAPTDFRFECPLCEKSSGRANQRQGNDGRVRWFIDCWSADCPSATYLRSVAEAVGAPGGSLIKEDPWRWLASRAIGRSAVGRRKVAALPTLGNVEGWHSALLANRDALRYLETDRGIPRDLIERVRLGYALPGNAPGGWGRFGAFTLPLVRKDGTVVNVRKRFWPEAPTDERGRTVKYAGLAGHGARLYPSLPRIRKKDLVVLVAGEFDALVGRANRLPTVSTTCGASLPRSLAERFAERPVAVLYDVGEQEAAMATVQRLHEAHARAAWAVDLASFGLSAGEDLTDFFVKRDRRSDELLKAIRTARGSDVGR